MKTNKQKKLLPKTESDVDKREWTRKGAWKESQIDWIICRIFTVRGHEDCILAIYNT